MNLTRHQTLTLLILAAAAARLLPHPSGFTPVAALALFGGAQFADRRAAFVVPLSALFLGDAFIGFHQLMPFVYGCFALTVCLGLGLRRRQGIGRIALSAAAGAILFYLITNFAVWWLLGTYTLNAEGLLACYAAGLPALGSQLAGDAFYNTLLFGGMALIQARFPLLREHRARTTIAA